MRTAIVATVADAEPYLETFVTYHLSIGFDLLILFFDDPNDPSADRYMNRKKVIAIRNDNDLRTKWKGLTQYRYQEKFIEQEVMARQSLNVLVAIKIALEEKIDWILHIDCDELFYSPGQSVADHFNYLASEKAGFSVYHNHEAIPENLEVTDFFREVRLFKKNYKVLNPDQLAIVDPYRKDGKGYFYFYGNGKSAARVHKWLFPMGVHRFKKASIQLFGRRISREPPTWTGGLFPCILHYPCCGFDLFWRKYKLLGAFGDRWFDSKENTKDVLPMHIAARDICLKNDIEEAKAFYKENFIDRYLPLLDGFKKEEICFEIPKLIH